MKKNRALNDESSSKLQNNYLGILRRRIFELRGFAAHCREARPALEECEVIHMRVHSLVGSGATYGYAAISEAAHALDRALDKPDSIGLKPLARLTDALIEKCDAALTATKAAPRTPIFKAPPRDASSPFPVLLSIDDDPAIHDLVQTMFSANAHVVTAYNGDEALDAFRRHCPDLILLDNYMPGMEGLKLLESMNSDRNLPPVPVIMLTANNSPHEIMRATTAGIADYVTKPFDPQALSEKISALLKRARMTVLIANDNFVMRNLVAGKLRRQGFHVMETDDGKQALALAFRHIPELILLNQSMTGMDGRSVLHALRKDKRTRYIPMLYLTANSTGDNVVETLNLDAGDEAVIPFIPEKITLRILDALGAEMAGT